MTEELVHLIDTFVIDSRRVGGGRVARSAVRATCVTGWRRPLDSARIFHAGQRDALARRGAPHTAFVHRLIYSAVCRHLIGAEFL